MLLVGYVASGPIASTKAGPIWNKWADLVNLGFLVFCDLADPAPTLSRLDIEH